MKIKVGVIVTDAQGRRDAITHELVGTEEEMARILLLKLAQERFFGNKKSPHVASFNSVSVGSLSHRSMAQEFVPNEVTFELIDEPRDRIISAAAPVGAELQNKKGWHGRFWRDHHMVDEIFNLQPQTGLDIAASESADHVSWHLLNTKITIPREIDLVKVAEDTFRRAEKTGLIMTTENATKLMCTELKLDGVDEMPPAFNTIFLQAIELARKTQHNFSITEEDIKRLNGKPFDTPKMLLFWMSSKYTNQMLRSFRTILKLCRIVRSDFPAPTFLRSIGVERRKRRELLRCKS